MMHTLALFLRVIAPIFVLVGALHLVLGLGADALLGAKVPPDALADPGLDSQNRFYGTAFMLYGVLLWLCSTDLARYATVLRCVLWVFFASGLARLVSILIYGAPPPLIVMLLLSELLGPPLMLWWLARAQARS
jgi:hypothetical protein